MTILAIETSCDETACAIVKDGVTELASSLATSKELHEKTGGIVPEVAARKQVESIVPVIRDALCSFSKAQAVNPRLVNPRLVNPQLIADLRNIPTQNLDALAVTVGPGLVGSLVVGVEAAKALSLAWNKPLIPVNHLVGHIYANFVDNKEKIEFPAMALVVSGGHTDLVLLKNHDDMKYIGGTLDDAAGEAFDKTARLLGLSKYLGGVLLSNEAAQCKTNSIKGSLPRPMIKDDSFDMSFSGLKTAVRRLVEPQLIAAIPKAAARPEIAREVEEAVVDVLVSKTTRAAKKYNVRSILLGGGVSANSRLRSEMTKEGHKMSINVHYPPLRLCTDNAVYIASAAYFCGKPKPLDKIFVNPSLGVMDKV